MNFIFLITLIVLCTMKVESGDYYIRDGIGYYVSYPDTGNWFEGMRFCALNRMYLIDIKTPYENERILSIINETETKYNNPQQDYWTSGNDIGHNKRFTWATTGSDIVWHYFDKGQPDNGNSNMEHCVHIWYGALIRFKWNDKICTRLAVHICRDRLDVPMINANDKIGWANYT